MSFLWFIIIGCTAGFLAGKFTGGSGFGLVLNLIIGVVGGILGGVLFDVLGIHTTSIIGSLITVFARQHAEPFFAQCERSDAQLRNGACVCHRKKVRSSVFVVYE